jgi:predicted cobalt transporter CbtA
LLNRDGGFPPRLTILASSQDQIAADARPGFGRRRSAVASNAAHGVGTMIRFLEVLFHDHNLLFVGLAAFLCVLACLATFNVVERAKSASGRARALWLVASAVAGGIGIWSTHFVAMLGFRPDSTPPMTSS